MATWPVGVPDDPLVNGYQEQFPNTLVRTQMDAGAAKVRRRFTAGVWPMKANFPLTKTQLDTFTTFYRTTLQDGALSFDWTHPRTLATVTCRFVEPPTIEPLGASMWTVSTSIEVLP